jgi:hypothetical protein
MPVHEHEDAARQALDEFSLGKARRARVLRRLMLLLLFVFIGAAALGHLGGALLEVRTSGAGYELRMTVSRVTRPGQDTDWIAEIRRPGGFAEPVLLAVGDAYLDAIDQPSVRPEPTSSTTDGTTTFWEFEPPGGDTLEVKLEGRFAQDSTGRHRGVTAIVEEGGFAVVAEYRTLVLP